MITYFSDLRKVSNNCLNYLWNKQFYFGTVDSLLPHQTEVDYFNGKNASLHFKKQST